MIRNNSYNKFIIFIQSYYEYLSDSDLDAEKQPVRHLKKAKQIESLVI